MPCLKVIQGYIHRFVMGCTTKAGDIPMYYIKSGLSVLRWFAMYYLALPGMCIEWLT